MRLCAKYRADSSNHFGDMADLRCFKMVVVLDLFYTCLDHPQSIIDGLCDCAKFGWNQCSNFDDMQVLIFCWLSLKMPIHANKVGVFS